MPSPNDARYEYLKLLAGNLTPTTLDAMIEDLEDARPGFALAGTKQDNILLAWTIKLLKTQRSTLCGNEEPSALLAAAEAMMALVDEHGIGDDDNQSEPVVNNLRLAITNARLQQPA